MAAPNPGAAGGGAGGGAVAAAAPPAPGAGQGGGGGVAGPQGPPFSFRLPFDPIDGGAAAEAWLQQVATSMAAYNWDPALTVPWALLQLAGEARVWVSDLSTAARTTWPAFETAFKERFCPPVPAATWLARATARRQGPTESAASFWRALRSLLQRVQPPVPAAHAFAYFLAGLRADQRLAVKAARITDVATALPFLRDIEPEPAAALVAKVTPAPGEPMAAPATPPPTSDAVAELTKRVAELTEIVAGRRPGRRQRGGRGRSGPCFVCGSREHLAHQCPRRFREDSRTPVHYVAAPNPSMLPGPPVGAAAPGFTPAHGQYAALPPPSHHVAPGRPYAMPAPPPAGGGAGPSSGGAPAHPDPHHVALVAAVGTGAGQLALPLSVAGADALALVDSGSPVCLFNPDVVGTESELSPYSGKPLAGANDLPIAVKGVATLPIRVGGDTVVQWPALAVPGLSTPLLLGLDFIQRVACSLDIMAPSLVLHSGKVVPLVRQHRSSDVLFVGRVATVPPFSMAPVPAVHTAGSDAAFEPNGSLVSVPELCLAAPSGCVLVVNKSPCHQTLVPGTPLARGADVQWTFDPAAEEMPPRAESVPVWSVETREETAQERVDVEASVRDFGPGLSEAGRAGLRSLVQEYEDVFHKATGVPSRVRGTFHTILASGPPIRQPKRRFSDRERVLVETHVQEMLAAGVIRESDSPWSSPVVLAQKKDNTIRFCVDYRRLNQRTRRDAYPLPRIDDLLRSVKGAKFFSCLDLARGYWQVPLDPQSAPLTAFTTESGSYEFVVLPFGLTNAPPSFQRMMDKVLDGLEGVRVYLDDILITAADEEEHLRRLRAVFQRLRDVRLTLKAKKTSLGVAKASFLGFCVDRHGVMPEPDKVSAVRAFPRPTSLPTLRGFLGLVGFYRQFIPAFSDLAAPLTRLLRKSVPWQWTDREERAFLDLKDRLTRAPVLAHMRPGPLRLYTDASNVGLGAVLSQMGEDGVERPLGFASRTLAPAETRYTVTERECLAVVWGLRHFRVWVDGVALKVFTDHAALSWLFQGSPTSGRLQRWIMELQQFSFSVHHRPGSLMAHADALSRAPLPLDALPSPPAADAGGDWTDVVEAQPPRAWPQPTGPIFVGWTCPTPAVGEGASVRWRVGRRPARMQPTQTPPRPPEPGLQAQDPQTEATEVAEQRHSSPAPRLALPRPEQPRRAWPPAWAEEQEHCEELRAWRAWVKAEKRTPPPWGMARRDQDTMVMKGHILCRRAGGTDRVVVPRAWRTEVMRLAHEDVGAEHGGRDRTRAMVARHFWWPSWRADVDHFVSSCDECQRTARAPVTRPGRRGILDAPRPWHTIAVDMAGPLPRTKEGNVYILVAVDHFTRFAITAAVPRADARTAARFWIRLAGQHGVPARLLTDRGSNFTARLFQEVVRTTGAGRALTTAYNPQGDSRAERTIGSLKRILKRLGRGLPAGVDWDDALPWATLAYNSATHRTTGETPYFLVHGYQARLPLEVAFAQAEMAWTPGTSTTPVAFRARLATAMQAALARVAEEARGRREDAPSVGEPQRHMCVGTAVLMWSPTAAVGSHRARGAWTGPYRVQATPSAETRRLVGLPGGASATVNVRRLKPYVVWQGLQAPLSEADGAPSPAEEQLKQEGQETVAALLRGFVEAQDAEAD